jgi:hypothetical protein
MKRIISILIFILTAITLQAQVLLLKETFQDWKAQDTLLPYSITKKLADGKTEGTFTSPALIAEPAKNIGKAGKAVGNSTPSKGRIVIPNKTSYLQLPELSSVGDVLIKATTGKDLREFKLQELQNGTFRDIPGTTTACCDSITKQYLIKLSLNRPATLRIVPPANSKLSVWDLEVYSCPPAK